MLASSEVFLKTTNDINPDIAIILGSGLTNFFDANNHFVEFLALCYY